MEGVEDSSLRTSLRWVATPFGFLAIIATLAGLGAWLLGDSETMGAGLLAVAISLVIAEQTRQSVGAMNRSVQEARELRIAQTRPVIAVQFSCVDDPARDQRRLDLVLGHHGGGPAANVRFEITPPLVNSERKDIGGLPPFSTGIALMAPGYRQSVRFDTFDDYRTQWFLGPKLDHSNDTPSEWTITISCDDPLAEGRRYSTTHTIGLEHLFEFNQTYPRLMNPEEEAKFAHLFHPAGER